MSGGGSSFTVRDGREKRLLLGSLALLAPMPLPFNDVLEWPVLFVYAGLVVYFLQRAERGDERWLPTWALNVLGGVYIVVFFLDMMQAAMRNRMVSALLHLILFLVVVKLFSIRRERDKWHLVLAIFFLFLGSMATSSHVTIGIYLLAFTIAALYVLARFVALHQEARFAGAATSVSTVGERWPLTAVVVLAIALAVPLFAAMPRLREPFVLGPGGDVNAFSRTTGFSDSVDLNLTTRIRGNRDVALRVRYSDGRRRADEARFKGATFDYYRDRRWHRTMNRITPLQRAADRAFIVSDEGQPVATAELYLEQLRSVSVPLPVETLSFELAAARHVGIDGGGAALLPGMPMRQLQYTVRLAAEPVIAARRRPGELSALDTSGVSDRMRELAAAVMGEGDDDVRIDRLESHLLGEYGYTVDFAERDGQQPIEDFLFVYRTGHCEYFASAMVLMLRSEGIPARLVTGFLGAEYNPIEGYFMVRQENAHAWVEAYTATRGWRVYDPTPPDGRPAVRERDLALVLSQLADFVTFRWDRYVLGFGADDQQSLWNDLGERIAGLWGGLRDWLAGDETAPQAAPTLVAAADGELRREGLWQPLRTATAALLLAGLLLAAWLAHQRRLPPSAAHAYRRLRAQLRRAGFEISESLAPLRLERLAAERFPAGSAALRQVVSRYVEESFAGRSLPAAERRDLGRALAAVGRAIRRERRSE